MKNEEMETEVVNDEDITIEGDEEMKENLFTKHFGVVFWVSRQIFNMFVLLRSVKIFYLCLF